MSIIYIVLVMLFAALAARLCFDSWDHVCGSIKRRMSAKVKARGATPSPSPARAFCVPDFRNINSGFHKPVDFSNYDSPAYQRRNVIIH
jgi:hypothetical protein